MSLVACDKKMGDTIAKVKDLHRALRLGRALFEAREDTDRLADADRTRRRRDIDETFADLTIPLACFRGPARTRLLASAAWNDLFGDSATCPPALEAIIEHARDTAAADVFAFSWRRSIDPPTLERPCRAAVTPIRDGAIIACVDLTEHVIALNTLVAEDALRWSSVTGGRGHYFNAHWCTYTGQTVEAALRTGWEPWVHPDDRESVRLAGDQEIEARVLRHDGETRWHRVRVHARGGHWCASAIDVDELHRLNADRVVALERERAARTEAERANRLKDQFLATVSHELRAPLTTMTLWEQVLRDPSNPAELRERALTAIRESAAHQSRIVGDLLDVSRAISGKLHLDLHRIIIDRVLAAAVDDIRPSASAKGIDVAYEPRSRLGAVLADAHRMRQILGNVLTNAVKFTPSGGKITITGEQRDGAVVIAVTDTGRGIAPELLPRLFQPFTQADHAVTRANGGLGLGLSIAQQLVMLHGGTITVASEGVGRGATFTISLPIANRPSPFSTPPVNARVPRLDGRRLLVIDDDPEVREALTYLLSTCGAEVDTAAGPDEARAILARAQPDAILCDIAMPGEDGYSFLQRLRASEHAVRSTPAIALTAYAQDADRALANAAGFDAHVAKPVTLEHLATAVQRVLEVADGEPPATTNT